MIKTEIEIIESYAKWKEFYERNEMPEDIEEAVYAKAESKWVKLDDLLLDLEGFLQAEDYAELKQCVSDLIDELKEESKVGVKVK